MDGTIEKIEELAEILMTVDEIAMLCDLNVSDFRTEVRGKTSERALAYWRGKLKTKMAFNRQVLDFALAGSPQSEAVLNDLLKKQKSYE